MIMEIMGYVFFWSSISEISFASYINFHQGTLSLESAFIKSVQDSDYEYLTRKKSEIQH